MQSPSRICVAFLLCLSPLVYAAQGPPAGTATPAQVPPAPAQDDRVLAHPPEAEAASPALAGPEISLDVVVTDKSGRPVPGLNLSDFTLLDNNQPGKILSFRAYDRTGQGIGQEKTQQEDPLVEATILFDTVNTGFDAVSYARQQVENFLRQDGGRLAVPVSIAWLTNDGVDAEEAPSLDGNALAAQLDAANGRLRTITRAAGAYGAIERFQFSSQKLDAIAQSELKKPGRKLLIWVGPGWPMLDGPDINISTRGQQALFGEIVQLSTLMLAAHIDLYSISQGMPDPYTFLYKGFLKGVRKSQQANIPNLSLKVLAVQSGGQVLPPTNDLASSIDTCLRDASVFYTLSFVPPPAEGPNQYHELKVQVDRPGLSARTNTGYYDQPERPAVP